MATTFKNKVVKEVGSVPILAVETDAGTRSTIIGMTLSNLTEFIVYASVLVKDDGSSLGFYMKDVMVPPNSTMHALSAGEKLILAPTNQLYLQADQDEALDAIISYVDIV
jgi:hypothetical protein